MNKIKKYEPNKNLKQLLEENFTQKEVLIGELLLNIKGIFGLTARTTHYFSGKVPMDITADFHKEFCTRYDPLCTSQQNLCYQIGQQLGISEERIQKIKDFIDEHETKI